MKRRRDVERKSEIRLAIEELSVAVKLEPAVAADRRESHIAAWPFLSLCSLILQLLDEIGPTMAVLRQDVQQNIQRLEMLCESDPATYSNLVEMLRKEALDGTARQRDSCSRALVWLTRCVDLTAVLLQNLANDPGQSMEEMVENSYSITMKPWHGWISATAYRVALKLLPDSKTFMNLLMVKGQDFDTLKDEIQTLVSFLMPLLEDIHSILKSYGVDRLKSP
ncbi:hypothetical protein Nepgr_024141 [Nepenthes gracilis]|uniref:Glycolipid transfer protein domain-containing protein n=1 Tax=Nepenthes gracilis TaxID=150966 RepID=A0AAD3T3H1_NEPGR|nr:hypothetical protein Nepgr_024141 [Nepenthes gracilis]